MLSLFRFKSESRWIFRVFNGDVSVGVALKDAGCVVHALVRDDTNRVFSLLYGGEDHGVLLFVGTYLSAKV